MTINLIELLDEKMDYLDISEKISKEKKKSIKTHKLINLKISFENLNLGLILYGKSKSESSNIQRINCKKVLKIFSLINKNIKFLLKNNIGFNNLIFIEKLSEKKNNNDTLLFGFLDIEFGEGRSDKIILEKIISYSCDFLSLENNLNNMCDFKESKCISCRERKIERAIGCCQKNCQFVHEGVCKEKNISCKLYMCDYVENRGLYFSPYNQPLLKKYLLFIERVVCRCMLFKSLDFEVKTIKTVRIVCFGLFITFMVGILLLIAL